MRKSDSYLRASVFKCAILAGACLSAPLTSQQQVQTSSGVYPTSTVTNAAGTTLQTNYLNETAPPAALPSGTATPGLSGMGGPQYQGPGMTPSNVFPENVQLGRPLPSTQPQPKQQKTATHLPPPKRVPEVPQITYPGLIAKYREGWIGSEYLYNMPSNIGVVVDIISPQGELNISNKELRDTVVKVFTGANINPQAEAVGEQPPLPFFHILILAYPLEHRTVAAVSGRYFEKATPARLDFRLPGTYQAITWEKQDMIITSPAQFLGELHRITDEIARTFAYAVENYYEQAQEQKSDIKFIRPAND